MAIVPLFQDTKPIRALVTGGASGIGWAVCRILVRYGIRCAIADLDVTGARARALALGEGHFAIGIDLADISAAERLPGLAADALGGLDIVINNAGITDTSGKLIEDIAEDAFTRLVAINLRSVEAICGAARTHMSDGGAIVNVASGAALRPIALRGAYSATKAGIVALTRVLNRDFAANDIRVSAIAPGFVRTDLVDTLIKKGRLDETETTRRIPLGRMGQPSEMAEAIAFLASPKSRGLAGGCLVVDGGASAAAGVAPYTATAPQIGQPNNGRSRIAVLGAGAAVEALVAHMSVLGDVLNIAAPENLAAAGAITTLIDARSMRTQAPWDTLRDAHQLTGICRQHRDDGNAFSLQFHIGHTRDGDTHSALGEAALAMFSRTLALEWSRFGSCVNAISAPVGAPAEVADLAAFLASSSAQYVTGQHIVMGDVT